MSDNNSFLFAMGNRVKLSREAAGLTQERLAEELDVSLNYISALECGRAGAKLRTLVMLCEVLHVTSDYLLFGTETDQDLGLIMARLSTASPEELKLIMRSIDLMQIAFEIQNPRKTSKKK